MSSCVIFGQETPLRGGGYGHIADGIRAEGAVRRTACSWVAIIVPGTAASRLSSLARQKLGGFITSEKSEDLRFLRDLIESPKITPAIDRAYPLIETPAAIRHVQDGRARGTIVITIRNARLESTIGVVRCVLW